MIFRIIQHAIDAGFIQAGDTVLDPFAGIGSGGLPCGLQGLSYVGVELEPRFCALAKGCDCGGDIATHEACPETGEHGPHHITGNLELWQRKYGSLPQWVRPVILQGDSRYLQAVLAGADALISSPPFANTNTKPTALGQGKGTRANGDGAGRNKGDYHYAESPANLGNMLAGDIAACIGSPPFSGAEQPCASQSQGLKDYHAFTRGKGTKRDATHTGETPGQLSAMAMGEPFVAVVESLDCSISSPPYSGEAIDHKGVDKHPERASHNSKLRNLNQYGGYGETDGQLGHAETTTFWESAKLILEQVHAILKPGGTAIWVLKAYVRDGQIVPFPDQWRTLAEACGFVTVHEHHALLVDEHREMGLFGEEVAMYKRSAKSFFRRLAEKGGAPEINYEVILCMRKTLGPLPPDEAWTQLELVDGCSASPPAAVIASPPYAGAGQIFFTHNNIDFTKAQQPTGQRLTPGRQMYPYGRTEGQLGSMRPGQSLSGEELS